MPRRAQFDTMRFFLLNLVARRSAWRARHFSKGLSMASADDADLKEVRIFLSYPGDLGKEREVFHQVVQDANSTWAKLYGCQLAVWDWQRTSHSSLGGREPQDEIFRQLGVYEIYVGLMHARFGTPTKHGGSGTSAEFSQALYLHQISQKRAPLLKFFFKTAPYQVRDASELQQLQSVFEFRSQVQAGGLVEQFDDTAAFRYQVALSLMRTIGEWTTHRAEPIAIRPVFLYFVDHFFLEMLRVDHAATGVLAEVTLAAKVAFLLAGQIAVSASSYVESDVCKRLVDLFSEVRVADRHPVIVNGRGENFEAYRDKTVSHRQKRFSGHYRRQGKSVEIPPHVVFEPRNRSATEYILHHWVENYVRGDYNSDIDDLARLAGCDITELRARWEKLPELLNGMDVIVPQVVPVLFDRDLKKPAVLAILHRIINELYFNSIQDEFDYSILWNLSSLKASFTPKSSCRLSFAEVRRHLESVQLLSKIEHCPVSSLEELRLSPEWQSQMRRLLLFSRAS